MPQTPHTDQQHRAIMQSIAQRVMLERLAPDLFGRGIRRTPEHSGAPVANDASDADAPAIRDLTGLLWAPIDNDDSRDLDQLTVAETLPATPSGFGWPSPP
jgi:ribonuclease R